MTGPGPAELPEFVQRLMARADDLPVTLARGGAVSATARRSAVLILFGEGPSGPDVLLIEKSAHLRTHAGQPAFPGGRAEPGEEFPVATALREAQEEAGVQPAGVRVVGRLPELFLWPSDSLVVPVVAWWEAPGEVSVGDPYEVARVARVPLAELTDPANRYRVRGPAGLIGPAFAVADMEVWGFTAAILESVLEAAGLAQPWDRADVRPLARMPAAPTIARERPGGPATRTVPGR